MFVLNGSTCEDEKRSGTLRIRHKQVLSHNGSLGTVLDYYHHYVHHRARDNIYEVFPPMLRVGNFVPQSIMHYGKIAAIENAQNL
jgi:hypothetical protein